MEILRDPAWQFIGTVLSLLALLVSGYFYVKSRNIRGVTYHIISNTTVLSVQEAEPIKGRVQVFLDNQPVKDARLAVIEMWNSGNAPIRTEHYSEPITFSFEKGTHILNAEIVETKPKGIQASLQREQHTVTLDLPLLNVHDSLTIKMLLSSFQDDLQVHARIDGVKKIVNKEDTMQSKTSKIFSVLAEFLVLFLAGEGCGALSFSFLVSFLLTAVIDGVIGAALQTFFGIQLFTGNTSELSNAILFLTFCLTFLLISLSNVKGVLLRKKGKQSQDQ